MTQDDFAGLGCDSKLYLQPHLQLLDLQYPVDELVLAVHKETPESDIMSNAVTERKGATRLRLPTMRRMKTYLAVHRFDNSIYYRRIDREAYLLLSALQAHQSLADSIDAVFAGSKLTPEDQAAKIQHPPAGSLLIELSRMEASPMAMMMLPDPTSEIHSQRGSRSSLSITGNRDWLKRSETARRFISLNFATARGGGFVTSKSSTDQAYKPHPERDENAQLARFANLLSYYTGDKGDREAATQAMRYLANPSSRQRGYQLPFSWPRHSLRAPRFTSLSSGRRVTQWQKRYSRLP